jgi:hypothetical protein
LRHHPKTVPQETKYQVYIEKETTLNNLTREIVEETMIVFEAKTFDIIISKPIELEPIFQAVKKCGEKYVPEYNKSVKKSQLYAQVAYDQIYKLYQMYVAKKEVYDKGENAHISRRRKRR